MCLQPTQKQIRNTGELITDGEMYLRREGAISRSGEENDLGKEDTFPLVLEERKRGWVQRDEGLRLGGR